MGILECKTTHEFNTSWEEEGVPFHYFLQVQTYLSALNMDIAYTACLFVPVQARYMAASLYQLSKAFGKMPAKLVDNICDSMLTLAKADKELEPYIKMFLHMMIGEFYIPRKMLKPFADELSKKFIYKKIERDRNLEKEILSKNIEFWYNYIEANRMPPLIESGDACAELINSYFHLKAVKLRLKQQQRWKISSIHCQVLKSSESCLKENLMRLKRRKKNSMLIFLRHLTDIQEEFWFSQTEKNIF